MSEYPEDFPGPTPESVQYEEFAAAQGFSAQHAKHEFKHDNSPGKTVQKWADPAMFTAEPIAADEGPQVYLLSMTPDPLGTIAAACALYEGKVIRDLSEVTDEDRVRHFDQLQRTHLKAPFEFVQFHFLIEGVTRGFTHQMVRQRTATYVQESTRFAVKEDMPVGLPPSLAGTVNVYDHMENMHWEFDREDVFDGSPDYDREPQAQRHRDAWDMAVEEVGLAYKKLVDSGLPAEDARGLLPTNLLTRIHYRTDLKSLIEHGGNRLCTQAQFEWRLVFAKIVEAIRNYRPVPWAREGMVTQNETHRWQYEKIADVFRPICYLTGKCEFKADFDRKCKIRDRVDSYHRWNVPSSEWSRGVNEQNNPGWGVNIDPIQPAEWLLDPGAAR